MYLFVAFHNKPYSITPRTGNATHTQHKSNFGLPITTCGTNWCQSNRNDVSWMTRWPVGGATEYSRHSCAFVRYVGSTCNQSINWHKYSIQNHPISEIGRANYIQQYILYRILTSRQHFPENRVALSNTFSELQVCNMKDKMFMNRFLSKMPDFTKIPIRLHFCPKRRTEFFEKRIISRRRVTYLKLIVFSS